MASIFITTKQILNLEESFTAFDLDVMTYLNAAFSTLNQLGVGPEEGFFIEDGTEDWDDFDVPANQLHLVKSYVVLKVRMMFDPPATSYLINAMNEQILQFEWRLNVFREELLSPYVDPVVVP